MINVHDDVYMSLKGLSVKEVLNQLSSQELAVISE